MLFRSLAVLGLLLVLLGNGLPQSRPSRAATASCVMTKSDERWVSKALANWPRVSHRYLKRHAPLPMLILFDARCSYVSTTPPSRTRWIARAHGGKIVIADGPTFDAGPQASFYSISPSNAFLLMSLPSLWRTVAPLSKIPLKHFLEGILFHELVHGLQAEVTPSIWFFNLKLQGFSSEQLSDDGVQNRFANDPTYAANYASERDLLYRAAAASTLAEARLLTCDALAKLRLRRARYFTGADAGWTRVDELSLTAEGLGQWLAFTWLTEDRKLPASLVLSKLRGPFWSQDEGLAIFLVVDRLVPGWQTSLLSAAPVTVEAQLAKACKGIG